MKKKTHLRTDRGRSVKSSRMIAKAGARRTLRGTFGSDGTRWRRDTGAVGREADPTRGKRVFAEGAAARPRQWGMGSLAWTVSKYKCAHCKASGQNMEAEWQRVHFQEAKAACQNVVLL